GRNASASAPERLPRHEPLEWLRKETRRARRLRGNTAKRTGARLRELGFFLIDDERRLALRDDVFVDDRLFDPAARRDVVHDVEHRVLEDGPETAGAGLAYERLFRHRLQRAFGELELHAVHLEETLVLLHERVLRLREDVDERLFVELVELEVFLALDVGAEAERRLTRAPLDDLLETDERAAADEEDVGRVDLQEILLRVLSAALGRHVGDGALDDLEERLLHALARDVAGDAGVIALAA